MVAMKVLFGFFAFLILTLIVVFILYLRQESPIINNPKTRAQARMDDYVKSRINLFDSLYSTKEKSETTVVEYFEDRFPFRKNLSSTYAFKTDFQVDSVTFCYDSITKTNSWIILYMHGSQQTIKMWLNSFKGWSIYDDLCHPEICFGHYNDDNYLDFHLGNTGGTCGSVYQIFLYNPRKNIFENNETLSSDCNLAYNRKTNIYQFMGRGGGWRYVGIRFRLINDKMLVIKELEIDSENKNGIFQVKRKLVLGKDTLIQTYNGETIGEDWLFSKDPYCEDFFDFKMKYRLKNLRSDAPVRW
jgi:hypothetical protein